MAKIIGVTVGTTTPRPNWSQTNTKKSDFIKNKPEQDLPPVTAADNKKVLQVEEGKWKAKEIADANALVLEHNQAETAHPAIRSAITEVSNEVKNLNVDGKVSTAITNHNTDREAHQYILDAVNALNTKIGNFFDAANDNNTLDRLSELITAIEDNAESIENITASNVKYTDIVDRLDNPSTSKVLSANQGVVLKALIEEVRAAIGTAINAHNADGTAHAGLLEAVDDLDTAVRNLNTKVTALENAKPNLEGYVTTEQLEASLGAYITDIDTLVGGGL